MAEVKTPQQEQLEQAQLEQVQDAVATPSSDVVQETALPPTPTTTSAPPPPKPAPKKPVGKGRRKMLNRIIGIGVAVAVLAVGVLIYRFLTSDTTEIGEIYAQGAYIGSIQSTVAGSGTASAKESAAITLSQSGTVQEVFVTGGDTVTQGQPLYTIYSQAAEDEVEQARKKVDNLQKDLAELQKDAANLTIRAPFAGKLQNVEKFEFDQDVTKGTQVAELVNDKKLKLSLYFSYAYENDIKVGQAVDVSIPAVMGNFTGKVEKVNKVSFITPEGAVHFEVVIVFDNTGTLTAGMDAAAVLTAADGSKIYPYDNAKTDFYEIRTIVTKASGPVTQLGTLLDYANVKEGEALLYLGSSTIDEDIRAKQEEIDKASEQLEEKQKALDDFHASAPIDGVVVSCNLSVGDEVSSGTTAVIISNTTTMLVNITVDDRNISFIRPGDFVDLDWNGNLYQGKVTSIDMSKAESGNGMTNYPVTLSVDNYDNSLMDGAWLQYSFVTSQSDDCVIIPTSAVKYVSDIEGNRCAVVFVQREQPPEDIPELDLPERSAGEQPKFPSESDGYYPVVVETGLSSAQEVEILSGVEEMDQVFVKFTVTDYAGSW